MTPEERAELSKLEDIAETVSRQYWQYIEKIARPIKGGKAGQDAFLSLLTIRAWDAHVNAPSELEKLAASITASIDDEPAPKRRGRPPKAA